MTVTDLDVCPWTFTCRDITLGAGIYDIGSEDYGLFGAADLRRVTAPRPMAHGMVSPGADLLGEQTIIIPIFIATGDETAATQAIVELAADWQPAPAPFDAVVTTPLGAFRLRGKPNPLDVGSLADLHTGLVKAIASWYVTDPRLRGMDTYRVTVGLPPIAVASGHGFPHGFPHGFAGGTAAAAIAEIHNAGNTDAAFTATFSGPLVNPWITRLDTGDQLGLRYTVPVGTYAVVDVDGHHCWLTTDPNDLSGAALRDDLIYYPDRADWFRLPPGDTQVRLAATSGDGQVTIAWSDTYLL